MHWTDLPQGARDRLRAGTVIPAHPLALDRDRRLDPRRQRALSRYYLAAGGGGLAVGVHTTQFAIREAGLYRPVLAAAAEVAQAAAGPDCVLIAGLVGRTAQAIEEARIALGHGYHAGLLSLAAMRGAGDDELIAHCRAIAAEIPLVGFYLQPAVGGLPLGRDFWRRFAEIENVIAIKIAPFNRYRTLDVVAGVAAARAEQRVTLYTGNDDHILLDLVTPYAVPRDGGFVEMRIRGGLLGHWSVWTKTAIALFERAREIARSGPVPPDFLALDGQVTDCNAAFFDVAHDFHGCIAGCHEVLRRQGLLQTIHCLDPQEGLSPGQRDAIDRVYAAYPHLNDDAFVAANLDRWIEE